MLARHEPPPRVPRHRGRVGRGDRGDAARPPPCARGKLFLGWRPSFGRVRRPGDRLLRPARVHHLPRLHQLRPVAHRSGGRGAPARAAGRDRAVLPAGRGRGADGRAHLLRPLRRRRGVGADGGRQPAARSTRGVWRSSRRSTSTSRSRPRSSPPTTSGSTRPPPARRRGATASTGPSASSRPRSGSCSSSSPASSSSSCSSSPTAPSERRTQALLMGSVAAVITTMLLLLALPRQPVPRRCRRPAAGRDGAVARASSTRRSRTSASSVPIPCDARGAAR